MSAVTTESPASVARRSPDGFYWGDAPPSYQIEGAWDEDGKGCRSGTRLPTRLG
jgi:hypothetical protein